MDRTVTTPARAPKPRPLKENDDLRWLLIMAVAFILSLAALAGMYAIYHATGPHPQVTMALRRMRYYARWLLPGI